MTRVLIVEDERIIAWNIREVLKLTGHDVISSVSTAEEAIALAGELKPDLVLMDIRLSGELDGIVAAEQIYTSHGIPSIYLTAHADDCTVERAMETAPFGYVLKPFKRNDLLLAIKVAIQRHQRERKSITQMQHYNAILNSLGDGAIATDADGHITYMNDAAKRITGWSTRDALGKTIQDVLDPLHADDQMAIADSVKMAIQNYIQAQEHHHPPSPSAYELSLENRNGHHINASTATPIVDDQDEVIGCIMTLRNVISHHAASPHVKPSFHESSGHESSEAQDGSRHRSGADGSDEQHRTLLAKFTTAIRESLDDKSIIQDIANDLGHDLGLLACHIAVHQTSTPENSVLIAAFCHANPDLTHFSLTGETRSAIVQQMTLRQPIHCCLMTSVDMPPTYQSADEWVTALVCPILNHHGALMGDLMVMRSLDCPFSASEIGLLQHMADQCAIAIRQSHFYQTVQSYQQDRGDRSSLAELPSGWITALSHELRTPISNIKMASQMLELALTSLGLLNEATHPVHEYFHILRYECQREARLVDALVEANQTSGTQVLTFNPTNLFDLIQEVVNPCLWQLTKKNQQLRIDNGEEPLIINTVPSIVKRVLGELLDHVCRYSSPGHNIHIATQIIPPILQPTRGWRESTAQDGDRPDHAFSERASSEKEGIELTIQYAALHLPADEINALLSSYSPDIEDSSFDLGSTGLGLFLAKQQLMKLNGQLAVRDDDGMITFSLYLPDSHMN